MLIYLHSQEILKFWALQNCEMQKKWIENPNEGKLRVHLRHEKRNYKILTKKSQKKIFFENMWNEKIKA